MNPARPAPRGALAGCALALAAAVACSARRAPPPGASGALIYELQNCANCHGQDREGTARGPALRDLGRFFGSERLAEYLVDPARAARQDARLRELEGRYPAAMGRYDNLTLEQRRSLADWLLAR